MTGKAPASHSIARVVFEHILYRSAPPAIGWWYTMYEIAKRYREQINPMSRPFSKEDTEAIKEEIGRRVRNELQIRVSKGYKGIDFELIGPVTENLLKELLIHAP